MKSQLPRPEPGTLYLLRHGETMASDGPRRYIGWQDVPLSEAGILQAANWAEVFANTNIKAIHSSDLSRCRDTANIISKATGVQVRLVPEFREIHLGDWEGIPFHEMKTSQPEIFAERGRRIADHRPPRGESFQDLDQRVWPRFESLGHESDDPRLIVTHAGVIRVLLCRILGMPLSNLFRIGLDAGSLTVVIRRSTSYQVAGINLKTVRI
jgi:alpha-ribazole phosphatase